MSSIIRLAASLPTAARRVFLAVPTYGNPSPEFTRCLMASERAFAAAGMSVELEIVHGHCHVDDCRNLLVRDFLESEATDFVFLDADVNWSAADLVRLARCDRDVVAGIYPFKNDDVGFPCVTLPGEIWDDANGLIEVEGVPGGFLKISRSALLKLEAGADQYMNAQGEEARRKIAVIFERTLSDGIRYSGDYTFCRKWRAAGGRIYVDPAMRFGHIGDKEWRGCFGDYLKARAGIGFEKLGLIAAGKEDDETLFALFEEWGNQFAGSIEFQQTALVLARQARGPILEIGSGLSTLIMAAANPNVQIHAIESDQGWASKLTDVLARRKMRNVTVHVRPLVQYQEGRWYDLGDVPDIDYALVMIDGPARSKGDRKLWFTAIGHLAHSAVWIMDDADDPEQIRAFSHAARGRAVHLLGEQRLFAVSEPIAMEKAA